MADFDKWRKALGDAAYLRVQQDIARRQLDPIAAERDRLFLIDANSSAYKNAQAQVEAKMREVESFTPRVLAADAEAKLQEPSEAVKRDTYCANAARARQIKVPASVQNALDVQCRNAGGNPMATLPAPAAPLVVGAPNAPGGVPGATPAPAASSMNRLLLPLAAVAAVAVVAGGAYFWSQQQKAAAASRRPTTVRRR